MANSRNSESPDLLQKAVAACLDRHLKPDQNLLVGFSGGRDSVALLHALRMLKTSFGFQLKACHVNHRLSQHAEEWQVFCRNFCDSIDVALIIVTVDVPRNSPKGLEAAARCARYRAFSDQFADWLVLGQHRGDQAETLLFNLLRGTGLAGAAGMPETRGFKSGMRLLRPLLGVTRKDIDAHLQRNKLGWVEDESNSDTAFSRNFLRHEVLPVMQSHFLAAEENLGAASERFAEALSLLDELAELDLAGAPAAFPVPTVLLSSLRKARARNLLRFLLARHGVGIPAEARLVEALRQLLEAKSDRHPAIEFGEWRLCRRRGKVYLEPVDSGTSP